MNAEKTGGLIAALRTEQGMTQRELAERINTSDKAVSRWETGRGFPDIGNLECLAEVLGVSVAELLRGERLAEEVTQQDVKEAVTDSFSMARAVIAKRKWRNLAIGFLCGIILITLAAVHITSLIPISYEESGITVQDLGGQELAAILPKGAAGYEVNSGGEPGADTNQVFVSAYDTLWHRWFGGNNATLIPLGDPSKVDYVYYYPSKDSDQLIWKKEGLEEPSGGVETLPRLLYNFWLLVGIVATAIGAAVCLLSRKKYYFRTLVKLTLIPAALTISTAAVLIGSGAIYFALYYMTGILLLAVLLYLLLNLLFTVWMEKKRTRQAE